MKNIMFICDGNQMNYIPRLKEIIPACRFITKLKINSLSEINMTALKFERKREEPIDAIVTNSPAFLKLFISETFDVSKINAASVSNYEGSVFNFKIKNRTIPLLIVPPIEHIFTKPEGKFIFRRFFSKIFPSDEHKVRPVEDIKWDLVSPATPHEKIEEYKTLFDSAELIAVDIETTQKVLASEQQSLDVKVAKGDIPCDPNGLSFYGNVPTDTGNKSKKWAMVMPLITMVGFTGIFRKEGKLESFTIVVDFYSDDCYGLIKHLCENNVSKTMQRGQYDCVYLMRFGISPKNYFWDTHFLMHAWYAELPRDLAFIAAFMIKNFQYWKDESGGDTFFYCAKDCHVTAWATVFLLIDIPDWARTNYTKSFPKQFPNITCALDGLKIHQEERSNIRKKLVASIEKDKLELELMTVPGFNPNSSQQTLKLMHAVLYKKAEDSSKITMEKFKEAHPLYRILAEKIQKIRNDRKALSNYVNFDDFAGRLLYEINAAGTDTSRFASKASSFWCGTQIQNIPFYAKTMFIPDDGFKLGAIDNSQSESRTTAYLSGDAQLINTVETARDFHTRNVALFFGYVEDALWELKKSNPSFYKSLRNTGKRVNHGANYNMGPFVLLNTMGARAVAEAKRLLKLPSFYTLINVCNFLLDAFDKAYPIVRGEFQQRLIQEIKDTNMLTEPTGWTRYCFGNPEKAKHILNSYVAHKPQCMSVQMINKSYYKAWYRFQIKENLIRMKAQIHDENFFAYREEHEDYIFNGIAEYMREPVETENGTLIIPNDWATGGEKWIDLKD